MDLLVYSQKRGKKWKTAAREEWKGGGAHACKRYYDNKGTSVHDE